MFWKRKKRELFCFRDGEGRKRHLDPMATLRAIQADDEYRPDVHTVLSDAGDSEATEVILCCAERCFGVKRYSASTGKGMTELEILALFASFYDYIASLKKNTSTSPTSPPSTDATSSSSSEKTTSDTSPSGSARTAAR